MNIYSRSVVWTAACALVFAAALSAQQSTRSSNKDAVTPAITPAVTTNVTTTGGTSGQVPVFNGTSSVTNSNIYTTSFGIGINHGPGTGIAFDVLGKMVVRGIFDMGRSADATTSAGTSSNPIQFHSQVYNSTSKIYLNPFFEIRSEPVGNNSASPSATFHVLYSNGTATEAETGLYINGDGTINFAPGQTFPSTANGITSVAHDSSLTGNGTSGSPLGLAAVKTDGNFTGNGTAASPLTFASNITVPDVISAQSLDLYSTSAADGVFAEVTTANGTGVIGEAYGTAGWGVYGYGAQVGVYGSGGTYAGEFNGDVKVLGNLSKAGGSFEIDDPVDPENKYLYHSFVESPDMKNIYDGVITTDGSGMAVVTMPDYFEALNSDFRYQLTVIGQFAQAIVATEIADKQFTIKTDKPNVKVSWQVTGIRQDAWANAHRIPVEVEKNETEKGRFLHPELFNHAGEPAIGQRQLPLPH